MSRQDTFTKEQRIQGIAESLLERMRRNDKHDDTARRALRNAGNEAGSVISALIQLPGKPLRGNDISDVHRMSLWNGACELEKYDLLARLLDAMVSDETTAGNIVDVRTMTNPLIREAVIEVSTRFHWDSSFLTKKILDAIGNALDMGTQEWSDIVVDLLRANKNGAKKVQLGQELITLASKRTPIGERLNDTQLERTHSLLTNIINGGGDLEGDIHGSYLSGSWAQNQIMKQPRENLTHNGLLAYTLFQWERNRGHEAVWEQLSELVVEMGGNWRKLLNGPDTTEDVKDRLRRVPGVRRALLGEHVETSVGLASAPKMKL